MDINTLSKEVALNAYIKQGHTQEECIGFIAGWEAYTRSIEELANMDAADRKSGINFKLLISQLTSDFKEKVASDKIKVKDIFILSVKGETMLNNLIASNVRRNPIEAKSLSMIDKFKRFCSEK